MFLGFFTTLGKLQNLKKMALTDIVMTFFPTSKGNLIEKGWVPPLPPNP